MSKENNKTSTSTSNNSQNKQNDAQNASKPNPHEQVLQKDLEQILIPEKSQNGKDVYGWGCLVVIIIVGALFLLYKFDFIDLPHFKGLSANKSIELVAANNQNVLFLINRQKQNYEIRFLNISTGIVQDISLGNSQISHTSLSPNGDKIAYLSDEQILKIDMINRSKRIPQLTVFTSINDNNVTYKVCEWSKLYWSYNSDLLAFFGCSKNGSSIFTVKATDNQMASILPTTESSSKLMRDAIWLKNGEIIFTKGKKKNDSLYIINPNQTPAPLSSILYEMH